MKFGFTLPQYELPTVQSVCRVTAAVESSGLDYLGAYDHVLGADVTNRPDWTGPYHSAHQFHEPLTLFSFLAALTETLELSTSVLVLPQRQTVLVAKQAAEVDVLSGGRLRLGVGIGWNQVEYQGLGMDFRSRGVYFEEQIEVLRLLWSSPSVTYSGQFHNIDAAGILPLPVQRPIPIWLGGGRGASERALKRVGRLADGWMPNIRIKPGDGEALRSALDVVRAAASECGRAPETLELEGIVEVTSPDTVDRLAEEIQLWQALGATRVTFRTLDHHFEVDDHLDVIARLGVLYGGSTNEPVTRLPPMSMP